MKKQRTEIFSIFGTCEAAAAQTLIDQGKAHKIELDKIPESVQFNDAGQQALFAVLVPGPQREAFEQLCRDMRA